MAIDWEFIIDWDNDGTLEASEEEQGRLRQIIIDRGRPGLFVNVGGGRAQVGRMQVGTMQAIMDNADQRYDPWHTSSPLYPNVKPGRLGRLRATYAATPYDMFKGYLDEPSSRGHKMDKIATLPLSDGWRLTDRPVRELALQKDQDTDNVISALLTAIGWPTELGQSLSAGSDEIPFFWGGGVNAYDLLHELAEAEFGLIFIPGDGKMTFTGRHASYNFTVATTLTDDEIAGDPIVESPWDSVRNRITITSRAMTRQTTGAEVWRLRDTPSIRSGDSITIWAELLDSFNRVSPAENLRLDATTDWTANTAPDGTGANLTASFTAVKTEYGSLCKVVITNNSAETGFIDYMRIWALNPIELLSTSETIEEDTASQTAYGIRDFAIDQNPWIQSYLHAKAYAEWIKSWASDPRPSIIIALEQRPDLQLSLDIGDIITYNSAKLGINENFRIGRLKHRTGVTPQQLFTEYVLEPFQAAENFWLIGTVTRSEIGQTTYVTF